MTDKMREEFERSTKFRGMDFRRAPEAPEYYLSPYANGAWDGWQASREALVIELPDADGLNREHMLVQGFLEGVAHTRVAIEAAGLKVKP
jgi:hypothetical protein